MPLHELTPSQLRRVEDPARPGFDLSSELGAGTITLGQDRALEAIEFALDMRQDGFNVFVLGESGSGRHSLAQALTQQSARRDPVPDDSCYVYDLDRPRHPKLLRLPVVGARAYRHTWPM